nr:preprotein translocase subunit SecE [Pacificimonas pallii]
MLGQGSLAPLRQRSLVAGGFICPNGREGEKKNVAKVSPGQFVREVRQEMSKVTWPTRRETIITTIMVLIMTSILSVFFLGVDAVLGNLIQWVLSVG